MSNVHVTVGPQRRLTVPLGMEREDSYSRGRRLALLKEKSALRFNRKPLVEVKNANVRVRDTLEQNPPKIALPIEGKAISGIMI